MAKVIDFTGDEVKKSISETMKKVIAYHTKNWREGNEIKVREYAIHLCGEELLKYLSYSKKDEFVGPLYSYVQDPTSQKYTKIFERWLLQYGPYMTTIALELASAMEWKNRYEVSEERKDILTHESFMKAMKGIKW